MRPARGIRHGDARGRRRGDRNGVRDVGSGELPPPRAGPVNLAREVLTDPNLESDSIVDAGSVEWTDLEANQEPGTEAENGPGGDDAGEAGEATDDDDAADAEE